MLYFYMKPTVLYQAKKVISLLSILQNEMTLLESVGYSLEHDLKRKAKMFEERLASSLERFYKELPENGQLAYFEITNRLEYAINSEMCEIIEEELAR